MSPSINDNGVTSIVDEFARIPRFLGLEFYMISMFVLCVPRTGHLKPGRLISSASMAGTAKDATVMLRFLQRPERTR